PGRPDLAFSRAKLAVFVNGCYWHRCPSCDLPLPKNNQDFWKKKFEANKARDKKKILDLGSAGWKVLVFWECEIKNDLDEVVEKIEQKLNSGFGSKGSST
ncbi:MAG: very short patch repair endonuclease, partial [Bacteroidota bacterium]|nr:very short patch repair endonuclease [Bacteroidota bacterium]